MNLNEQLFHEIEIESKKLDDTKKKIADSLYYMFKRYLYSIEKEKYWIGGKKLKIGKVKIKIREDWDGNFYIFKVYVNGKKAIHLTHVLGSYGSHYDTYIKYFDINKLLELQEFHNELIKIITENLLIKKEKFEALNNFNLALKELEI